MHRSRLLLLLTLGVLAVAPAHADARTFFQSPSGNIGCLIGTGGVRCDILEKSWAPSPRSATCPRYIDWGNGVRVGRRGKATFTCASDSVAGQGRKLAYGKAISAGRFRCRSLERGMRCRNLRNGHGFGLSRQRARRY